MVVYAKRPFGGAAQVFRYLGRYTHRVGLSNHRLRALEPNAVRFAIEAGAEVTLRPGDRDVGLLEPRCGEDVHHAFRCNGARDDLPDRVVEILPRPRVGRSALGEHRLHRLEERRSRSPRLRAADLAPGVAVLDRHPVHQQPVQRAVARDQIRTFGPRQLAEGVLQCLARQRGIEPRERIA